MVKKFDRTKYVKCTIPYIKPYIYKFDENLKVKKVTAIMTRAYDLLGEDIDYVFDKQTGTVCFSKGSFMPYRKVVFIHYKN